MPTRILTMPGMGDIHWVALKLESFCKRYLINDPELWVWNFDGRPRSLDFVKRLPMCSPGGYFNEPVGDGKNKVEFDSLYFTGGKNSIKDFRGFDYVVCVNGSLTNGKDFQTEIMPNCAIDWDYELKTTPDELEFGKLTAEDGKYLLFYFSKLGMFKDWVKRWPVESIVKFLQEVHYALRDYRVILTGCRWDIPLNESIRRAVSFPIEDYVGATNLDEFLGLVRNASGFAGWCGGNTIISTHLKRKTYILWSLYFKPAFYHNWANPALVDKSYIYDSVDYIDPINTAKRFIELVNSGQ